MKRIISYLLALAMLFALVGCGKKEEPTVPAETTPTATDSSEFDENGYYIIDEPVQLYSGAGSMGSAFYTMSVAMADLINNNLDNISVMVESSAGSGENFGGVASGDFDIGISTSDFPYYGVRGGNTAFAEGYVEYSDCKCMFMTDVSMSFCCSLDNSKVQTWDDIFEPGVKVATQIYGSGTWNSYVAMFEANGIDFESQLTPDAYGHTAMAEALKDGNADVAINMSSGLQSANSAWIQLAMTNQMNFIPFPKEFMAAFIEKYPMYCYATCPIGWTEDNTVPYETVGLVNAFICRGDLDEKVVYNITKCVCENIETLEMSGATWANVTPDFAASNLPTELHPGAAKYFEENNFNVTFMP